MTQAGESRLSFTMQVTAFFLGVAYVVWRRIGFPLPESLIWVVAIGACIISTVWVIFHRKLLKKDAIDELLAKSWPLWFGLLWLREWPAGKWYLTTVLVTGLLCTFSLYAGQKIAKAGWKVSLQNPWLPIISAAIYTFVFWLLPSLKYWHFTSFWMDLGFMVHPIWNTAHGRLFEYMLLDGRLGSSLGDHFSLIFLFIAPIFKLFPYAPTLFFIQSLGVALGGIMLYQWAHEKLSSRGMAFLFQLALYFWFPLQYALISDFHADPLAVPFLFLMLWAYDRKNGWLFAVGLLFTIMCKEHMGIALAPVLLVLAFKPQWRIRLIAGSVLLVIYTLVTQLVLIPYFNAGNETMSIATLYPGGDRGFSGMLSAMVENPGRTFARIVNPLNAEQLGWIFGSILMLPILVWPQVLAMSTILFKEMYGSFYMHNHHQAILAPLLFWSLLILFGRWQASKQRPYAVSLVICCVLFGFLGGESPLSHRFWRTFNERYWPDAHAAACHNAVKLIPNNVSVSASSHIAIHLFRRKRIYLYPRPLIGNPHTMAAPFLDENRESPGQMRSGWMTRPLPEYIVFDKKHDEVGFEIVNITFEGKSLAELTGLFDDIRQSEKYDQIYESDGVFVLKKK